jgi:hypothetical protein
VTNEYYFISQWRVAGTYGAVADVLGHPLALPNWWPSVYLDVWEVRPPINNVARGIGQRVKLHTYAAVGLIAGAAAIGGTLAYLIFRSRRR